MNNFKEEVLDQITKLNAKINDGKNLSSNDLKTLFLISLLEEEGSHESK